MYQHLEASTVALLERQAVAERVEGIAWNHNKPGKFVSISLSVCHQAQHIGLQTSSNRMCRTDLLLPGFLSLETIQLP